MVKCQDQAIQMDERNLENYRMAALHVTRPSESHTGIILFMKFTNQNLKSVKW